VTIHIVDVTNESPVRNQHIYISGISRKAASEGDERLKLTTKPISADLSVITDNKGEARFDLPKPAPAYFYVRAALSGPHWDCLPRAGLHRRGGAKWIHGEVGIR
jgi:hypothetical protein